MLDKYPGPREYWLEVLRKRPHPSKRDPAFLVSPDGQYAASIYLHEDVEDPFEHSPMEIIVWRIADGTIIQEFQAESRSPGEAQYKASFSTNSSYLAVFRSSFDHTLQCDVIDIHILTLSHSPTSSESCTIMSPKGAGDRLSSVDCRWSPDDSMVFITLCFDTITVVQRWNNPLLDTAPTTFYLPEQYMPCSGFWIPTHSSPSRWLTVHAARTTGNQDEERLFLTICDMIEWSTQDTMLTAGTSRIIFVSLPKALIFENAEYEIPVRMEVLDTQATLILFPTYHYAWIATIPLPIANLDSLSPQWIQLPGLRSPALYAYPSASLTADHTRVVYLDATHSPSTIVACSVSSGEIGLLQPPAENTIDNFVLAPNDSHIAVSFEDGVIHLYTGWMDGVDTGVLVGFSNKHKTRIRHMKFTPDGQTLCSMDDDGVVCFQSVGHLLSAH